MRKIYLLPNFITTANMFCGFYSIVLSLHSRFETAAWSIVLAGIFDLLDGRIARLAKATSQFGVEYDSLSDLLSFGVAPSVLLYVWLLESFDERWGLVAAFLFVSCGALRLARFNVNSESVPKNYFQGLPIPVAAGVVSSFTIFYFQGEPLSQGSLRGLGFFSSLILSGLMVSTLQFPSFKALNWRSKASFPSLFFGILLLTALVAYPERVLFLLSVSYVVVGVALNLLALMRKGKGKCYLKKDLQP